MRRSPKTNGGFEPSGYHLTREVGTAVTKQAPQVQQKNPGDP